MRSLKVIVGYLLVTACASQPLWTPRSAPLAAHDQRRDVLGVWRAEFVVDTVDSLVGRNFSSAGRRAAQTPVTAGTLRLLDSMTPDRGGLYTRFDRELLTLLCHNNYDGGVVDVTLSRKEDQISLVTPRYMMLDTWPETFAAGGRYYGDSIVGTWARECAGPVVNGRQLPLVLRSEGRFWMRRTAGPL